MKQTREQIAQSLAACQSERDCLQIALSDAVAGKLHHIGRAAGYTVRVCRALGAHGGVVVLTFCGSDGNAYTSAHYFEEWAKNIHEATAYSMTEENLALRALAEKGAQYIRDAQRYVADGRGVVRHGCLVASMPDEVNA